MKYSYNFGVLVFVIFTTTLLFTISSTLVYAESSYDINIPSGSADQNAPYHWQSEKDGDASGYIQIVVGDTVVWKNAGSVDHTVVSGTPKTGLDNKFDSGIIHSGNKFSYTFLETGKYPYYCSLHPWKTGMVDVVSGMAIIPNVGSDVGDGKTTFEIEYDFNRVIRTATIDEESKSILFSLQGRTNSDDNTLTILLPNELISGISQVNIDGDEVENFSQTFENGITTLVINEIPPQAKEISLVGTTIVPEFEELVLIVLALSLLIIILFTQKFNKKVISNSKNNLLENPFY